jgi:hypothetical protein
VEAEWHNRANFAPFAEALGIDTDCIMSVMKPPGAPTLVLYTEVPTSDPDAWIMLGVLDADADGILIATRRSRFKTVAQFNEGLREHMERAMKGELGE